MPSRKLAVALLVTLCLATVEAWDIHTDDGCAVETHCNACLLKLGTAGEPGLPYAPPPVVAIALLADQAPAPAPQDASPRDLPTRGPPPA